MILGTTSSYALQKALNSLIEYCNINGPTVNIAKTEILKFRSGGRLAKHGHCHYLGKEI